MEGKVLYLYPKGTEWPSYTSRPVVHLSQVEVTLRLSVGQCVFVEVEVKLRSTVSRLVSLCVGHTSRAHDHILIFSCVDRFFLRHIEGIRLFASKLRCMYGRQTLPPCCGNHSSPRVIIVAIR
jgi:hypothetical protein